MTFREGRAGLGRRLAFLLGLGAVCVLGQECKTFPSAGDGRRTVLFAEAFGDGAGAQLYVYALLSELRATHRYETYVSRRCRRVLSAVFTATSLSDVPVLEDAFCLENPEDAAGKLEPFAADAGRLVEGDAPLYGKALWLWPRAASSHEGQPFFQGYKSVVCHQDKCIFIFDIENGLFFVQPRGTRRRRAPPPRDGLQGPAGPSASLSGGGAREGRRRFSPRRRHAGAQAEGRDLRGRPPPQGGRLRALAQKEDRKGADQEGLLLRRHGGHEVSAAVALLK